MPQPPLPQTHIEFLSAPHPSVIGSVEPDGSPHTAATWYLWDDGHVLVNMDATRRRLEYMRNDARVSLTVVGKDAWYQQVTLRGRVAEIADDDAVEGIDRLSKAYTGKPYARRDQKRVNARIEIESWYGWIDGRPWT